MLSSLLTVPCLMDVCALYGAAPDGTASAPSARRIARGMLALRPGLTAELANAASLIAENLTQVVAACSAAAAGSYKDPAMLQSLLDGTAYLRDVCATLCALVRVHPPAAAALLTNGPALIEAFGGVHDAAVPDAQRAAANGSTPLHAALLRCTLHVEVACERAVDMLIVNGYLSDTPSCGGSSSTGAGSSSGVTVEAVAKGEALLSALTLLGHRDGSQHAHNGVVVGGLALGPALAQRHGLAGSIQMAKQRMIVALDEAQEDYLAALMDVASLAEAPVEVPGTGRQPAVTSAAGPSSDDDAAVLLSLVSQVRELLPDFGEGFVAACLEAVGRSTERAINALLEGALPAGLEALDPHLTFLTYQQQQQSLKGNGSSHSQPQATSTALQSESFPALSGAVPRVSQKPRTDSLTARYLDAKESSYAQKLQATALEAQYEYEDEYDDGQDEFLHLGADGVAEVEGDMADASVAAAGRSDQLAGAFHTMSLSGPSSSASRGRGGGSGQRGGRGKGRLWILDGKVYHYPKPGATEVANEAEAAQKLQEAKQAALEIHGLGPGGNVPLHAQQQGEGVDGGGGGGGTRGGGGRGRGRGGGGRGEGRSSHAYKDKNKAAIGNHHRKDRATQKMARGMQ